MGTKHHIAQGDCLSSIAEKYGFGDPATIFDHPDNTAFKKKHPNLNVLPPGETLVIPDKVRKTVGCATGQTHVFTMRRLRTLLRIHFQDQDGVGYADKRYTLKVGGQTFEGKTDGEGLVEEPIPANASTGELVLFLNEGEDVEGYVFPLQLGHLDPPHHPSGAQARLRNLGYELEQLSGTVDEATREALAAFQRDQGIAESGHLDAETSERLQQEHEE